MELYHYGIKGMKWGVRRRRNWGKPSDDDQPTRPRRRKKKVGEGDATLTTDKDSSVYGNHPVNNGMTTTSVPSHLYSARRRKNVRPGNATLFKRTEIGGQPVWWRKHW